MKRSYTLILLTLIAPALLGLSRVKTPSPPEIQVASLLNEATAFPDGFYETFNWSQFENWRPVNDRINYYSMDYNLLNAAIFYYTNKYRSSKRLPTLKFSKELRDASTYHSIQMINKKFYSHTNKHDRSMRTVLDRTKYFGFRGGYVGENLAFEFLLNYKEHSTFWYEKSGKRIVYFYGTSMKRGKTIRPKTYLEFAEAIVKAWIDSPGHRSNLLNRHYRFLGCGVMVDHRSMVENDIPRAVGGQNFGR